MKSIVKAVAFCMLLAAFGLVACDKKNNGSDESGEQAASGGAAGASVGSAEAAPQPVNETIGCEGASLCAEALKGETRQPLRGFQSQLEMAATWEVKAGSEDVKEERCNNTLYSMTRAEQEFPGHLSLPEACRFDSEQLWEALGGVHENCDALEVCAGNVKRLDPDGEAGSEAQALLEAAEEARKEGYAGEKLCSKLIDSAINKGWGYDTGSGRCYVRPDGYLYMNEQAVLKWTGASGEADQGALLSAFKSAPMVADAYVSGYGPDGNQEFQLSFKPEGELDAKGLETWASEEGNLEGWELVELFRY